MDEKPRRRSGWKILGGSAAAVSVLLGTVVVVGQIRGARKWAAMEARVKELLAEVKARDARRPVLRGEPAPGNAWDDYEQALAEVKRIGSKRDLDEFAGRTPKADRAKVEEILRDHAIALEHLRRGAARQEARYPYEWDKGDIGRVPGLLQCQRLANFAVSQARLWSEAGRAGEAADLLLDTAQFARDLGTNGFLITEMIAAAIYALAFEELRDVVLGGRLGEAELSRAARELEILDRTFVPHGLSLLNSRVILGAGLLHYSADVTAVSSGGASGSGVLGAVQQGAEGLAGGFVFWRYGFSSRLGGAMAFEKMDEWMTALGGCDDLPWDELARRAEELAAKSESSGNPLLRIMMHPVSQSARVGRERRAQLRLLRAAVHFRATGEVLELPDPFGTALRHARAERRLKVWSVGPDGADHGGAGGWKAKPGPDMVLEVER